MPIDWFTVVAQALNFLILVWLLKRFLYRPILNAIDEREKRIAERLADADARKAEAGKERDEYRSRVEEIDRQRADLLARAAGEATAERGRLMEEARAAADSLSARRLEALRSDARNLDRAIGRRVEEEVFAIARRALADLASASLEERMVEAFTRRLREMDAADRELLARSGAAASGPALVRSAFDLPPPQRAAIQGALDGLFAAGTDVRFETAPDPIGGIELVAGGRKVAWSIGDYLSSLEKDLAALLDEEPRPEPLDEIARTPKPVPKC